MIISYLVGTESYPLTSPHLNFTNLSIRMKVSVRTPIYNHSVTYVCRCIESLKNQIFIDIGIILLYTSKM